MASLKFSDKSRRILKDLVVFFALVALILAQGILALLRWCGKQGSLFVVLRCFRDVVCGVGVVLLLVCYPVQLHS